MCAFSCTLTGRIQDFWGWGANLFFDQFLPKTHEKWRKLFWQGRARPKFYYVVMHFIFTAPNEVGARLCFHRRVWFCSQGGVCASVHAGIPSPQSRHPPEQAPPQEQTPPLGADTPPGVDIPQGADTPRADTPQEQTPPKQTPPGADIPTPPADTPSADTPLAEHAGRYGQHAGSKHPTGMQSCTFVFSNLNSTKD